MNAPPDSREPHQLALFRQVYGPNNGEDQSNVLMFWDSIPKYSVSRQQQARMRDASGKLPTLSREFRFGRELCRVEISPAYLYDKTQDTTIAYYPSTTEELIEDVLRKFLLDENLACCENGGNGSFRTGVHFTLRMIYRELKRLGKTRSIAEIKHALEVLSQAKLKIRHGRNKAHTDSILSSLTMVSQEDLAHDPDAVCVAFFARPISDAISSLAFRQLDYGWMMKHNTQLARWMFRRLSYQFINASLQTHYRISQEEIEQDSGLLHHARARDRRTAIRQALKQLVDTQCLTKIEEQIELHNRTRLVFFILHPHPEFIKAMKRANKRQQLIEEGKILKNRTTPGRNYSRTR